MRIISKFHDYYDTVQGVMYDSNIIFHRKNEKPVVEKSIREAFDSQLKGNNWGYYSASQYIKYKFRYIGFCGKIYPVVVVSMNSLISDIDIIEKLKDLGLTYNKHDYPYPDNYVYEPKDEFLQKISSRNNWSFDKNKDKNIGRRVQEKIKNEIRVLESLNLFEKYKTPIFILDHIRDGYTIEHNPILKDYGFQHMIDPYTAFQELVMWINNLAVNEYPPQITDDVVMRDKKGFDKWSFKNKPTKKR